jgi:hypothetical protein
MIPISFSKRSWAVEGTVKPAIKIRAIESSSRGCAPDFKPSEVAFHMCRSLPDFLAGFIFPPAGLSRRAPAEQQWWSALRRPAKAARQRSPHRCQRSKERQPRAAKREKRQQSLPVFAFLRTRPKSERKTNHHNAGNPADEIPSGIHFRPE